MHHVRQENLPFVGSSHELSERTRATPVFPCSCFTASPVRVQVPTGILMTRFSSSAKAAECGP